MLARITELASVSNSIFLAAHLKSNSQVPMRAERPIPYQLHPHSDLIRMAWLERAEVFAPYIGLKQETLNTMPWLHLE